MLAGTPTEAVVKGGVFLPVCEEECFSGDVHAALVCAVLTAQYVWLCICHTSNLHADDA